MRLRVAFCWPCCSNKMHQLCCALDQLFDLVSYFIVQMKACSTDYVIFMFIDCAYKRARTVSSLLCKYIHTKCACVCRHSNYRFCNWFFLIYYVESWRRWMSHMRNQKYSPAQWRSTDQSMYKWPNLSITCIDKWVSCFQCIGEIAIGCTWINGLTQSKI